MEVAASAKDAATVLTFGLSDGSVRCVTDALDGTDASLGALSGTDCIIRILQSVVMPFAC